MATPFLSLLVSSLCRSWFPHSTYSLHAAGSKKEGGCHLKDKEPGVSTASCNQPMGEMTWKQLDRRKAEGVVFSCVAIGSPKTVAVQWARAVQWDEGQPATPSFPTASVTRLLLEMDLGLRIIQTIGGGEVLFVFVF